MTLCLSLSILSLGLSSISAFAKVDLDENTYRSSIDSSLLGSKDVRVRLGFKMISHDKVKVRSLSGDIHEKSIMKENKLRMLKTNLNKSNHFYIDGLHIETIPGALNKTSKMYSLKLNVYRVSAKSKDFEEFLTSVKLHGKLEGGQNQTFQLKGLAHASLKDKFGVLRSEIFVGDVSLIDKRIEVARVNKNTTHKQ